MTNEPDLLTKLTPRQKKAVTRKSGPLMIIAGAGTGKTTVLTRRIAWLVEHGVEPENILALTFTEKASTELEGRLDDLLPLGKNNVFCATFHGFGQYMLQTYARGIDSFSNVLTNAQAEILVRGAILDFPLTSLKPLSNPTLNIRAFLQFISRCKDELISADELEEWATKNDSEEYDSTLYTELAAGYRFYQQLLEKNGWYDYGDLLMRTYSLLKNEQIKNKVQKQFSHILIDEYQDTNFAQCEIVKLLAHNGNVTVVGDDDQSIYRFRGASVGQMERFLEDFPNTTIVTLVENFRSNQGILNAAYELIQNNNPYRLEASQHISKKLVSSISSTNAQPILHTLASDTSESEWIVTDILGRIKNGAKAGDHCILVRSNASSDLFMRELDKNALPYVTQSGSLLKNDPLVRLIINFLKSTVNPLDPLPLYFLATSPVYNLAGSVLMPLLARSRSSHQPLEELLAKSEEKSIEPLLHELKNARDSVHTKPTSDILMHWINNHKILAKMSAQADDNGSHIVSVLTSFFALLQSFENTNANSHIFQFLDSIEVLFDDFDDRTNGEVSLQDDAVRLYTIHTAKGLEFPTVYCTNLSSDRFPSVEKYSGFAIPTELLSYSTPEGEHKREERRLMYVAMTRAKHELILTRAEHYGKGRPRKPSIFLTEFSHTSNENLHNPVQRVTINEEPALRKLDIQLSPYKIDDYQSCPLRYKFAHVDHIPQADNQHLMVGRAMHQAIDHFFNAQKGTSKPSLHELQTILDENWYSVGFLSREHMLTRKNDIDRQLSLFYRTFSTLPSPAHVEFPFEIPHNTGHISGRIDAIFETALPNNERTPIILDFKTSDSVTTQEAATKRAEESTQLTLYAYAWRKRTGVIPSVGLYFTASGLFGWSTRSERKLSNLEAKVDAVAHLIALDQFDATPSSFTCAHCPFQAFCPSAVS